MGYRSDVGYVLSFPSSEQQEEFLAVAKIKAPDEAKYLKVGGWSNLTAYFERVYWGSDSPDVKIHAEFMELCMQEPYCGGYYFVRIGEDLGDLEEEGNTHDDWEIPYDYLYVRRSMEFA